MKVVVLYRPESEHARIVEDFIHELQRRIYQARLEIVNVDSRDGIATASLYDVMQYPAIMVLTDDGQLQQSWLGNQMPLLDDVAAYARA